MIQTYYIADFKRFSFTNKTVRDIKYKILNFYLKIRRVKNLTKFKKK
jgi:hypothetical protein